LAILVVVNVLVFLLYGYDKWAAKAFPRNRISENFLIGASLLLAFPGAELARRVFHHKTQDVEFKRKYFRGQLIELGVLILLVVGGVWAMNR